MPIVVGPRGPIAGGPRYTGRPSAKGTWSPAWDDFRVYFARDGFAIIINIHGTDVLWEKSAPCPNNALVDAKHHHDFACRICDGYGRIYLPPEPARMLVQAVDLHQNYTQQARVDSGTARITAMPEYRLSEGDRFTITKALDRFEEKVLRNQGDFDDTKYPLVATIPYDGTPGPFAVLWKNRSGALQSFVYGTDYDVSVSGRLHWLTSSRPDAGDYYSVAYHFHPRYIVIPDLLHQFRLQNVSAVDNTTWEFPVQVMAKYEYLLRDESRDAAPPTAQDPLVRSR